MEVDDNDMDLDPLPDAPVATAPAVFTFQRLRPTVTTASEQDNEPSDTRGLPYLSNTGHGGIPFVYQSASQEPAWRCLDKGWGTPAFCHLASHFLQQQQQQPNKESDVEWLARFLAYIRLAERHELPTVIDHTEDESATGDSIGTRMITFKNTAAQYTRLIDGMVLIAQEEGGADWPGHARIHVWVSASHPRSLWYVLAVLFSSPRWEAAPPFWANDRMETALAHESVYLEFWKTAYARYQSRLGGQ